MGRNQEDKKYETYGISGIIAEKMNKANIVMAVSDDAQTMALSYKGKAIAVGNVKSIKETLKNIFTLAKNPHRFKKKHKIKLINDCLTEATLFSM